MNLKASIAHMRFRIFLMAVLLLWSAALFAQAVPAAAQAEGVSMKVTPAYSGNFKYGEWLPVWVELQNQGGDLEAEIRIQVTGSQGTMSFQSPVSLPSGAHKRVVVYVLPNNFSRELDVRLVTSDGKAAAAQKATIRPQPNISYFTGLLAPERGALTLLNGITFPGQERPKVVVDLNLNELAKRVEGLRSFDLIVINDTDTSKLTPDQAAALATWVQGGGRLVIGGGAGAQQTLSGLPADLLPAKVSGTMEIGPDGLKPLADYVGGKAIQASGRLVIARGEAGDSKILAGDRQTPLVQERCYGSGTVDLVAFDLSGAPFNGWPGTQTFWETLLGPGREYPNNIPFDVSARQFRANSLNYALSNIPSLDLPSIQGLTILLVIYILVVGPLNYLVLRRLRKMHWAWISIPVLTLLFTAGGFGIGYTLRGNDLILNKIALVELKPDGNANVTSYMGLFSPRMQSYEVTVQGESLISPMMGMDQGPWGPNGAAGGANEMVFIQGRPARVRGLTVNQWAMQSFMGESTWQKFGKITSDLRIENETLVGKVRNDSGYTITDAALVMQSRYVLLGDLAPGAEKPINLGISNLQADRFGPPLSYKLYQERYNGQQMPRMVEIKSNIVSSIFENGMWSKMQSSMRAPSSGGTNGSEIMLLGWLDQAPPAVDVPNNRLSQKTTALVYTSLEYGLPQSGVLGLPAGIIPGSMTKTPQDGGNCGTQTSVNMNRGTAEFEFQIPGNLTDFQVRSLKLALNRDNGGNPAGMPTVALYDWSGQSWTNIQEPIQGTNVIQRAAPYINENGVVRIKLTSENNTQGCIYLDLGLEAERAAGSGG